MKRITWKNIPATLKLETMSLDELMELTEGLFPHFKKARLTCFNFVIGHFPYGYVFEVVNSRQRWNDKGYTTRFGAYKDIKVCIVRFLTYVRENKINIRDLWEN